VHDEIGATRTDVDRELHVTPGQLQAMIASRQNRGVDRHLASTRRDSFLSAHYMYEAWAESISGDMLSVGEHDEDR